MSRDTINVVDPVTGEAVDVPAHPESDTVGLFAALNMSSQRAEHEFGGEENLPTAESLPVRLVSDFSTDPVEGEHGKYTDLVAFADDDRIPYEKCPNCGYDRARVTVHTFPGQAFAGCHLCDWSEEV